MKRPNPILLTLLTVACLAGSVFYLFQAAPVLVYLAGNATNVMAGVTEIQAMDPTVTTSCIVWMIVMALSYSFLL